MNILIETAGLPPGVLRGWLGAFHAAGHTPFGWDHTRVPAFDAFDELVPAVYVKTTAGSRRDERKALEEYGTPVVLRVDPEPAFDDLAFAPGEPDEALACDVAYVGDYEGPGRDLADRFLLPLCGRDDLKVKVFGRGDWPVVEHLGAIAERDVPALVASATVLVDLSAGRLSEMAYRAMGLGGTVASNQFWDRKTMTTQGERPPEDFARLAIHKALRSHPSYRLYRRGRDRETILASHTYRHRVAEILRDAGFPGEDPACRT